MTQTQVKTPWISHLGDVPAHLEYFDGSMYEAVEKIADKYPNQIAFDFMGRSTTYKRMIGEINRCAKSLRTIGVRQGDRVTIAMPNCPQAIFMFYAVNLIGAVANMIHPLAGEKEIINYLNEVKSRVAVLFEGTYQIIKDAIKQTAVEHSIVVSAGESLPLGTQQLYFLKNPRPKLEKFVFQHWKSFLLAGKESKIPAIKKDYQTLALISHTGGTTGEPKGVMLSDYNINSVIWQIGREMVYDRQEINMAVLPPFINYSLVDGMLAPLAFGFKLVLIPSYNPKEFDKYIKKYAPNHLMASIPAYYEPFLHNEKLSKMDLSCLKHIYYGGEKMNSATEQALNEFLLSRGAQFPLAKGLGSTEMVSAATVTYEGINLLESSGIPLVKIICKIVDPDTYEELPYNKQGEICMTGPSLMLGYFNRPDATADVVKFHSDGLKWLHTGDLGYINELGAVFVTGRIKRIIMTRGADGNTTKMFPDRIENAIYKHPSVELCCVIGVSHPERINYPKALVVLKEDQSALDKVTEEILRLCRDKLPDYMVPDEIEYRHDLPRTSRGKVDYRALEKAETEAK